MKNTNSNFISSSFGLSWLRASLNVAAFACASLLVITSLADAGGAQGARVRRGNVSFSQDGNRLIVRASNGAIIEYDRLSVEAGQIMQFIQPSATSRVLNRVTGSELTRIDGTLLSNGIVYLINPQGFRIGNGAVIKVGGFFAAAGAMSNSDFVAGRDRFTNLTGQVTNEGLIQAQAVALVGQYVANRGTIDVGNGYLAMGAGDSVVIQKGTGPVMVTVSRSQLGADGSGSGTQAAISNTGTINAGKGSVSMASGDFYALAMDLSGSIIGKSIAARGGKDGVVAVNGTLDASSSTGKGGTIDVFGDRVGLFGNALVNANGATGGGSIRIGGDYLGTNAANAPQANRTVIGTYARITANATQSGDGGRVIVWSNEYTGFFGSIEASAAGTGKGGFIETSSKDNLQAFGRVDASSALGQAGTWLLDPSNVLITTATAGGAFGGGNPDTFTPTGNSATVDAGTISSTLSAGTDVIILTASGQAQAGNITMTTGVTMSGGGSATLTLNAVGSINLSADITATAGHNLNVVLLAGSTVTLLNAITTQGGNLTITANGAVNVPGVMSIGGTTTVTAGALNTVTFNNNNNFVGAVSIVSGSDVIINDVNGLVLGASNVANSFNVTANLGDITNTGALVIGGLATFTADGVGANITLGNVSNDFSGSVAFNGAGGIANVTVVDLSAFDIGTSNFSGNLNITAGGNITSSGPLTIGGSTTASAAGFDVTLSNAANNFTGAVSTVGNNVTIVDANGLNLGGSNVANSFNATATAGNITNSGALAIGGAATFTAAGGASITVNNAGNNFGSTVTFASAGTLANVTVSDLFGFDIQALTLTGNLSVTAGGAITNSGALIIGGTTTASAAGSDVDLNFATNNFAGAVFTTGDNVTIVDADGLILGTSTATGTFDATATLGDITNTGALTISGAATFTADAAAASISVNNAANNFGAAVSFASTGGLANVTVVDTTAFAIQALTLTGALSVTAGGAITNSGALIIGGTTLASAAGFGVNLDDAGNDFTGAVSASGVNVTINDISGIILGASTVTGALVVTNAGNVTQTGVLAVTGTTTLTPGAANSVTLNSANQFGGAVSVTTAANVSLTNASGLALGAITASGTLAATANTGNITNTGALVIGGVATFTASAVGANITVANGANDFTGAVLFGGAGLQNVTVFDLSAFDIGASTLTGNLSVTAGGAITNSGALIIGGTTLASAAGFDVDLDFATNNFTGAVSTTGANVTIVDVSGLILGASTVLGTFDATATAGNITNTGALAITGDATFTASAVGANITVANGGNDFTSAVLFGGAGLQNVTVFDLSAFDIEALTLTGDLSVTAGGAITNSGALIIGGTTLASAAGFDVDLDFATNNFTGAVSTTGANVTIVDVSGLILGASTVPGTFDATATAGNITNTGALAIAGAATFTANAAGASISVNNAANNFGAAVAFAGAGGLANVTVVDTTAFDIQALTLTGALSVTAGGAITNSGALVIGGTTTASASGFNVTLANAANDFTGAVSTTGAAVSIVDANGLILGGSTVSGTFAATATAGDITNTGALLITGAATFTANAAAANISVNNAGNDFASSVSFVGAGGLNNVTVVDLSAFDIGASNLSGALSVTAGGIVTDSGALIIAGTTTVIATGFDVTLNNANNFGGAVSASGANVTLNDINAIVLGASTVTGNLVVTNAGNVTQTGVLAVTGTTTLTPGAANSVTLNSANQFGGAVSVTTATNVSLTDASGLVLGAITASGTLGATATTGNITNTGALLITGAATFTAGNAASILAGDSGNNFGSTVTFVASAGTLANVTVTDLSAFDLQALTLTGNLIVTASGAVTDSGTLNIGGTTNVTARGFGVTLDQLGTLGGLVTVNTSGISGIGGNIILTSTASFSVQSLLTDGFDNPAGAGFNGGNITLDAGVGNSVTLTASGFITTIGGDATGAFAGGDGGDVTFLVNAIIGGGTTINLLGGTGTPDGTTGTLTFFSTILNGPSTYAASVSLGNVTVIANSSVTVSGTLTLGTVTGGGFNLILSVEDLVLTGAVNNLANLTIQNIAASGAINIGTSTVGALNLSQAEWNFINAANVTNVFLGNTTSYAGTITNLAWQNNTNLTTDFLSGGGGSWHVDGNISGTGSITLHGSGGTTFLNTAFMTQANFNLNDSFLLQVLNCVLTSTNAGGVNITTTGFAAGISAQFQNSNLTFNTSAPAATFIFNGDFTSNGGEFINNFTLISGPIASPGTANINLSGQITGALLISRASALSLSSASTLGFIPATFTAGSVTINSGIATTLNANSTFITSGNISFGGTLDGARNLSLTAGAGDITFSGAVGSSAALRVITIASARNVTASSSISADSFLQSAGSGTTTFTGAQIYSQAAGLNVTNQAIALNNGVDTAVAAAGGIVTLNATLGSLAINSAGDISSDGAVNLTGVGGISTGGDVLTTGDIVNFNSATTLTGAVLVSTAGGDINFAAALTGPQALTLQSFAGNITFGGAVGAVALTSISINAANNVTAAAINAGSFTQVAGTGTTSLNGLVTLTGALDLNGTIFNIAGGVNAGGLVSITNSGALTTTSAIVAGGGFTQDGSGPNTLGGNITTTDDAILFTTGVTLTSGILMNTVSVGGGNDITFSSTIDGPQTLGLTAGTGNIVFGGVVGGTRLGAITITSANNVTAVAITAASLQQVAGTGTTTFNGAQNYNTIAGLNVVTGGSIALNSTVTTTASGTVTLTGTTAVTIAAAGDITSDGAVNFTSAVGGISTAGDVTTTNDVVNYNSATTLTGAITLNSGGGNIKFFSTLAGGNQNLTIAGATAAGTTTFTGAVSGMGAAATGAAITLGSTGLVDFQSTVGGANGIVSTATAGSTKFQQDVTLTNGDTGSTFAGTVNFDGMTWSGFDGLTVTGAATLSTGAVSLNSNGSAILLSSTLAGGNQNLTIAAGTAAGTTTFTGAVSGIGTGTGAAITLASTGLVDFQNTVGGASGIVSTNGAGSTKFQQDVTLTNGDTGSTFTGTVNFDGMNWSGFDGLTVTGAATLSSGAVSLNSNAGNILFSSTLAGGNQNLTIAGGTAAGTTTFTGAVSGMGTGTGAAITLASTGLVDFQNTVGGASGIVSSNGAGSTKFQQDVTLTNGDTGSTFAGAVNFDGMDWSGFDGLTVTGAATLSSGAVSLNSRAGNILFSSTMAGGNQNLTIAAGTAAGTTTFTGAVSGMGTGTGAAITLVSTGLVDFQNTVGGASGIVSIDALGSTKFQQDVTLTNGDTGSSFNGTVNFDGMNWSGFDGLTVNGAATLSSGAVSLNSNGSAILFGSTLDGSQALTLVAGAGNITFTGAVGGSTAPFPTRLGAVTVTSGATVLASSTFTAASFTQAAGTVATTFTGLVNLTNQFDFTGQALSMNGVSVTSNVVGTSMDVTNAGLFTTANGANLAVGNEFTQDGAGLNSIGGNISSTNDGIAFATGVTLTNSVLMTTGLAAGDDISFGATLTGAAASTQTLGLTAGAGDIAFTGAVGATRLGAITITSARNVTASSSITASSLRQVAGTGTTTFNGAQNYDAAGGLNVVTGGTILLNNTVTTTSDPAGIVTLNAATALVIAAAGDITSAGAVNLTGAAAGITTAGDVTTSGDVVNYNSATTLSGNILVTTGAGVGDINFLSTLDGPQSIGLTAGTGNVLFTGAVGFGTRLGAITVSSATNVSVGTVLVPAAMRAASFTQSAGTGTTLFSSTADLTNQFAFTGNNLTMNGVGSNVVGTTMTVTNAGLFTTANGANISTGGAFTQNGITGLNSLGGNITTTDDVISFATGVTLTSGILMNTVSVGGGNNITFSSTIDGPQTLGLTAGTGNIVFGGIVGATRLGAITITSANNVTAVAITAASFQQVAGTGTTTFNGAQNYNTIAGLNVVTGGTVALNSTVTTTASGTVTLTGTTLVTIAAAGDITSDGAVNFTSTGGISTAGDVTTTNDVVNYNSATTLTGNVLENTGAGVGDINYFSTLNGTFDLGLTAGTGNILFAGAVGAVNPLGAVTVTSATNVTFNSSFAAASYTQNGGTGDTTYNGLLNLSGVFSFIGNALTLNGIGNNVVGSTAGGMTVTNAGLFTTANGANVTVGNAFVQNGAGLNSIGGNIASTNDGIAFATGVTLTNGVTMATGAGAADNIVFGTTLNGNPTLGLTAGLGNITFTGAVGGIARLGAVTVTSGATVLASSTFTAGSFTQAAGTVATTFTGLVNLTNQFAFTGTALNMNGSGANVVGTTATVTNSGLFTTANGANLTVGNAFVQNGAGLNSIGGNIASTNDGIAFATGVTLTNGVTMTTGAGAGDNIVFGTTLTGAAASAQTLALTAGLGNITFTGAVGATRLGAVTINSAATVLASSTFTAASFTQSAGSVATTFTGLVDLTNQFAFTGTALNMNGSGANVVGTTATVTNSGLFTTANGANLTVGNAFVQNGAGSNSLGGSITSTNDSISFLRDVTLTAGITMTSGGGLGDVILFSSTVDGTADDAQSLDLSAGLGSITFQDAVGSNVRLGEIVVINALDATFNSTVSAFAFTQLAGTGTTTFAQLFDFTNNFEFTGNNLTVNGVGDNTVGTNMDVNNDGLFTTDVGSNLVVVSFFDQFGDGANSIGGDITSSSSFINFDTQIDLTNDVVMTSGQGVGDDISFGSFIDGEYDLVVSAGVVDPVTFASTGGDVYFRNSVGSIEALRSLTVTSADSSTHFFADVTTVGDQLYTGGASIDGNAIFTATDTLANITFNGAINNGAFVPSNMTVDAGGNVIFNGNIGAVSALGTFTVDSGNDLGETITFGAFGSVFFDPTANFEVSAESVQLNTGATSTLAAPATVATIASQSDLGITFVTDEFAMGQNHKLTSYGDIEIVGLTLPSANTVTLGDVNAVGDFTVVSDVIQLLARSGGSILTNTGGTTNDPMVDVVVGGRVYFSTAPLEIGTGKRAAFSNPTGNVDGWGTLGNYAKTVYPSAITRSLLTGLGGEVLDLSASSGVSYTNPATLVPSPMPILPAIGILGNSDTLDEAKDKEKAKAVEDSTKKTASESNPEPTGIPVASR